MNPNMILLMKNDNANWNAHVGKGKQPYLKCPFRTIHVFVNLFWGDYWYIDLCIYLFLLLRFAEDIYDVMILWTYGSTQLDLFSNPVDSLDPSVYQIHVTDGGIGVCRQIKL